MNSKLSSDSPPNRDRVPNCCIGSIDSKISSLTGNALSSNLKPENERSIWLHPSVFILFYLLQYNLLDFLPALLSVYDKTDLVQFAEGLHNAGVQLLGSGGTAKKIRESGIPIKCASFTHL